jgi:A/G-specific adenine glycosylase
LRTIAAELVPEDRPGDFAQALMDLGATICTPRRPNCPACPLAKGCKARKSGTQERYPIKAARKEKPTRYGIVFVVRRADGAILVGARPDKGLLGGMTGLPTTEWTLDRPDGADASVSPINAHWRTMPGLVKHVFTHFNLELLVRHADVPQATHAPAPWRWSGANGAGDEALPTLFRKALQHALDGQSALDL